MNWKRWIRPSLIATLIVAGIAVFAKHGAVERDLADRIAQQLSADGLGWASATVSARDVIIRGTAPSTESQDLAIASAAGINGVRGVQNASDLLPLVSPYVWTAHREGPSVVLSGSVPSEGSRAAVLAAARRAVPDAEIRDAMELARGAPASFNSATTIGLTRLATLGAGTVTLTDGTLAVSGTASDAKAYAEAQAATSEPLPAAVNRGLVDIQPARADPFVWSVNFDGKSVTMVGFVPNTIVHETLLATTKATLPGVPILDSVAVASGEPSGFAEAASFAIGALERLSQGGVTLDGLNLDVAGTAKSVDDYDALLASLAPASLPAGLKAVTAAIAPAVASPYGWQGEKSGAKVVLSGYVPSAAEREDVAATARIMFAGAAIEDQVRVAAGEPRMDWIGAIKFAMEQLSKLERGKVSVGDQTYAIEGEARSAVAYAEILDANGKTLPASLELTVGEVTPPRVSPYRFSAERRAGGLVMSGNVASEADREAIFAAAHRKFGAVEISGDIVFASGEPRGFVEAAGVVLQVLTRLVGGHVEIADKTVTVDGLVYQAGAIEDIADALADSLPEGFSVASNTVATRQEDQPVAAEQCRGLLQTVLKTGRIAFDGTKADIAGDSVGVLDRVSAAIARCPEVAIEVGAHSDSEGSSSRNRDRTQARAEAIVDFLVSAGVKRERLAAVGYGETKPVADNNSDQGKAANRRIEFSVELPSGG